MKRWVATPLLLCLILLSFSFVILRFSAIGSENNFFNSNLRSKFAANKNLRKILQLSLSGDAKADYLGDHYTKILIEIDEMDGLEMPTTALDLLKKRMAAVTGKDVSYFISDKSIPYQELLSQEKIDNLYKQYKNFRSTDDTAGLHILYLSKLVGESDEVGSTRGADGMALFAETLNDFTKNNPDIFGNYVESTALHEFGHLLGLEHNNYSDCLMQAYADLGYFGVQTKEGVITDFCNYEKDLLKENAK